MPADDHAVKPRMLNILCAYPQMISWCLGAAALNIGSIYLVINRASESAVLLRAEVILPLAFAMIPATLLGYFLGMFTCWPVIRVICCKINGAPFLVGDAVLILSGSLKGKTAKVYETTVGQGGWKLLRLDPGKRNQSDYSDIYEEYAVIRIHKGESSGATAHTE